MGMMVAMDCAPRSVQREGDGQKGTAQRTEDRPGRCVRRPQAAEVAGRHRGGRRHRLRGMGLRKTLPCRPGCSGGRSAHRAGAHIVGRDPRGERPGCDRLRGGTPPGDGEREDHGQGHGSADRRRHERRGGPASRRAGCEHPRGAPCAFRVAVGIRTSIRRRDPRGHPPSRSRLLPDQGSRRTGPCEPGRLGPCPVGAARPAGAAEAYRAGHRGGGAVTWPCSVGKSTTCASAHRSAAS